MELVTVIDMQLTWWCDGM